MNNNVMVLTNRFLSVSDICTDIMESPIIHVKALVKTGSGKIQLIAEVSVSLKQTNYNFRYFR